MRSLAVRCALAAPACGVVAMVVTWPAGADATDDYPIPRRMINTTCDAEQVMAATRDTSPVSYERYLTDYNNKTPEVQQGARDRIHWFFSLTPDQRRAYSEEVATNVFGEAMAFRWPNWAKMFFNNKGVVAKSTDVCMNHPPGDMSVWTS